MTQSVQEQNLPFFPLASAVEPFTMARHSRMNMEWTLASCRTPRNTRKMVEEAFHRPSSGSNRVSKPKSKKNGKPLKNVEIKGSWDHTGDDSSQLAEGEGNESEDGSEDSNDKHYVKGPALTSRGQIKGKKNQKNLHSSKNKKASSAGPMNQFSRQKGSVNRRRDTSDETPTKSRNGASLYTQRQRENTYSSLDSDLSDTSSFTMDLELEADEDTLNEYNMMISDTDDSDLDDEDGDISSDDLEEDEDEDDEEDVDFDDDDQSIVDEETEFIIGMPPHSDDPFLGAPVAYIPNSPSALSEDDDEELEDIYMDMDDPVVQKIMNHSYTICDDVNDQSDDMLEPYFSDEATEESDEYDSDATVDDEPEAEGGGSTPKPKSASPSTERRPEQPSTAVTPTKSYLPPRTGFFKANPNRLLCLVESISGVNRVLVMTVEEYYGKADSSSSTSVTTPGPKASEELFAYLPTRGQFDGSAISEDLASLSSYNKNFLLGSDWEDSSVIDASFFPQWTDYIVENLDALSDDFTSGSIETLSVVEDERRNSEVSAAVPAFAVPITAFRANQNNALSRSNSTVTGVHSSGIKKNAPRKDSSLTPSQRRKSDATQGRSKTPTPPIPFPVPLEPLFADTMNVNPAA